MKINFLQTTTAISTTLGVFMSGAAFAADIDVTQLPAVSAPNGKIEIYGGWTGLNGFSSSSAFRGAASFSVPVGERLGLQADIAAANAFGDTLYGGTLHAFTRDPNSYLFGLAGGLGSSSSTGFGYVGPEAELYMGNVSLEAYAGFISLNNAGVTTGDLFALGDAALYATPDLRLGLGVSTVAGFKSAHAGLEWQMESTPISFKLDGRIGDNGFAAATAGLTFYFGGTEKSLMRRHREDDPRNRSLDIFNAGGSALTPPPKALPVDPCIVNPESC